MTDAQLLELEAKLYRRWTWSICAGLALAVTLCVLIVGGLRAHQHLLVVYDLALVVWNVYMIGNAIHWRRQLHHDT